MNKINQNEEEIKELKEEIEELKEEIEEYEIEKEELEEELEAETDSIYELIRDIKDLLHKLQAAYKKYPENKNDDDDDDDDYDDRLEAFYAEEINPLQEEVENNLIEIGVDGTCGFGVIWEDENIAFYDLKEFLGTPIYNEIKEIIRRIEYNKNRQIKEIEKSILRTEEEIKKYEQYIEELKR